MAQLPELFDIPANYPAQISSEIGFKTVQFIKNAPLQPDYWQLWKKLYKICETYAIENPQALDTLPDLTNLLLQALVRLDQMEHDENSQFPTWKTVLYMKRRGRRLLKFLAINAQDTYIKIALHLLETIPQKDEEKGYIESQRWLSYYIIYANSRQIIQKNTYQAYTADWSKFQYNTIQTHASDVWDNDKYASQIMNLWQKTDKVDILEWLSYWHNRNKITFPKFTDKQLIMLFEAENAPLLHHIATQQAYQTYTMQGLSANLHAYMYFYADNSLRKKIDTIKANRPKMDDFWQKFWVENYAKITFQALKNGNTGKRIQKALLFLLENHKDFINKLSQEEVFEMSDALFAMPNPKLQEIAFLKLKNAKPEEFFDWINAWNNPNRKPENAKDNQSFERLLDVAMPLYKENKKKLYNFSGIIQSFLNDQYFMVMFGCKLTIYASDYDIQIAFQNITNNLNHIKQKTANLAQKTLGLMFKSNEGINAFLRLFKYSSWIPSYYPNIFWALAKENGATRISTYFEDMMINLMNTDPIYNLQKLFALYPNEADAKKYLLEKCIEFPKLQAFRYDNIAKTTNEIRYDNNLDFRHYAEIMFWFIFHNTKIDETTALNCFEYIAHNQQDNYFSLKLWENILLLVPDKQGYFCKVVQDVENNVFFYHNASLIPEILYTQIAKHFSSENITILIENLDENTWTKWSKILLDKFFENGKSSPDFLENLLPKITSNANLGKRLFQNPAFATFFKSQKNPALLNISLPEYEEMLFDWLWNNTDLLPMDSQNLFKACLHKLPSLRKFALNFALKQGFTTYFMLKLSESDMPDAMRTAHEYVQSIDANDKIFLENVLAICDSPNRGTRKFAESVLLKNKTILLEKYDIIKYLQENSDVAIQNFVANILIEIPKTTEKTAETPKKSAQAERFTQEMFRQTNRNRHTKEILKQDITLFSNVVLLEIARTGAPKDKEWAIAQLALKSLAGEKIEGFTVEG